MTRAELQALLDAAGITGVALENIQHPNIVYVKVGGSADNRTLAREVVESARGISLLHAWIDRDTQTHVLRVELRDRA